MSCLALILTDLYAPTAPPAAAPALPALSSILRFARSRDLPGAWQGWLAHRLLGQDAQGLAPGALAAAGWGTLRANHYHWLATPVHYFAGLDSVHLHPAGLLQLSGAEQAQLAQDFARVFVGSGFELHATGRRELLLSGPMMPGVRTSDPAPWLGSALAEGLPHGEGSQALRRLGTEIEMWLYQHSLNLARQRDAQLPVTGLWLWAGGAAHEAPARPASALPALYAQDAFAEGVYRLIAGVPRLPPADWAALRGAPSDAIVVLHSASAAPAETLQQLEQRWFAPLLQDIQRGVLGELQLIIGARGHRLRRTDLWKLWRRPRPWWEKL